MAVDALGNPLRVILSAGQIADIDYAAKTIQHFPAQAVAPRNEHGDSRETCQSSLHDDYFHRDGGGENHGPNAQASAHPDQFVLALAGFVTS